ATKERAQGSLAAVQASGSHAKRLGSTVGIALGFALQHLATGFPGTRADAEPSGEVLLSFPGRHVKADFAGQNKQRVSGQTGNGKQIDSTFFEQQVADIDSIADAVAGRNLFIWSWWFIVGDVGLFFHLFDYGLVTVSNLGLIHFIKVDGLSQGKEMFLAIVADQRFGNSGSRVVTAFITITCQHPWIAFASEDRFNDPHAGNASDV